MHGLAELLAEAGSPEFVRANVCFRPVDGHSRRVSQRAKQDQTTIALALMNMPRAALPMEGNDENMDGLLRIVHPRRRRS